MTFKLIPSTKYFSSKKYKGQESLGYLAASLRLHCVCCSMKIVCAHSSGWRSFSPRLMRRRRTFLHLLGMRKHQQEGRDGEEETSFLLFPVTCAALVSLQVAIRAERKAESKAESSLLTKRLHLLCFASSLGSVFHSPCACVSRETAASRIRLRGLSPRPGHWLDETPPRPFPPLPLSSPACSVLS